MSGLRAGFLQLVENNERPVGDRVAVLYDWRVAWDTENIQCDLYARDAQIVLNGGRGVCRTVLFNDRAEKLISMWPQTECRGWGTMTLIWNFFDMERGLYTTNRHAAPVNHDPVENWPWVSV